MITRSWMVWSWEAEEKFRLHWNAAHLQLFWLKRQLICLGPLIAGVFIIGYQINTFISWKWSCRAVAALNQLWYQQNSQRTLCTWLCVSLFLSRRCCLRHLIFSVLISPLCSACIYISLSSILPLMHLHLFLFSFFSVLSAFFQFSVVRFGQRIVKELTLESRLL